MCEDGREPTVKEHVLRIVGDLPDDTSLDHVLRELAFHRLVRRGLADLESGRTVATEGLWEKARAWRR